MHAPRGAWIALFWLGLAGCAGPATERLVLVPSVLPDLLPTARLVATAGPAEPAARLLVSAAQWRRLAADWGLDDAALPTAGFDWRAADLLVVALGAAGGAAVRLDRGEEEGVDVLLVRRLPPGSPRPAGGVVLLAELERRPAQLAVVFLQMVADAPGHERTLAVFAGR